MIYGIIAVFLAIPIIAVIGWLLNLIEYCKTKRNIESNPDINKKDALKPIKTNLIISSVIAFVLVAIIVGLIITFAMGIAYM